jgi:hypothetical protein
MIVVLAQPHDEPARAFVDRAKGEAVLLTARDLSEPGWIHRPPSGADRAPIAGRRRSPSELAAVVTRMAGVAPAALGHIQPSDRDFVAAEMNAFLLSWLAALDCPVINRPTAGCLMGPPWSRERWLVEGCRVDIEPFARTFVVPLPPAPAPGATRVLVVVGDECVGDASAELGERARALARNAGVSLVGLCFDERDRLVCVEPWPDIARPDVSARLLRLIGSARRTSAWRQGAA